MTDETNHDHLSLDELSAFARGQLTSEQFQQAEAHILICQACCDRLRDVDMSIDITEPRFPTESRNASEATDEFRQHGRFLPGEMIGDRYRIVSMLGIGGMGEVYRADDLLLNQAVALKFLESRFGQNQEAWNRLHGEVRVAREIAHPSVCRVYDTGEWLGQPYLSMEYIDGEDLSTLLQRIGKLPRQKGVELAEQLCRGVQAAHRRGILHRDLKPANVMIDGRGRLKITDFGLATLADTGADKGADKGADTGADQVPYEVAGTPAYMAPEQVARGETSVQSDLFSLGLVLAEVFTGEQLIPASNLADVTRFHEQRLPPTLSHDLLPEIEPVVRQCLAKNPQDRPGSIDEVLAVLPATDPLSDVLAAGRTPSPELLVKHRLSNRINSRVTLGTLIALVLGTAFMLLAPWGSLGGLVHRVDFPMEPAVLRHQAQAIVQASGFFQGKPELWSSEAYGFRPNLEYSSSTPGFSDAREHSPYYFWYRTHVAPMVAERRLATRVSFDDPAPFWPGMVLLRLDLHGRLVDFHATPYSVPHGDACKLDFSSFFTRERIGMDFADLELTEDLWTPQTSFDQLYTWKQRGVPDEQSMRVLAATYQGRLIACRVVWPASPIGQPSGPKPIEDISRVSVVLLIAAACLIARRNVVHGYSDRLGAFRLAWGAAGLSMLGWLFTATLTGSVSHDSRTLLSGMQGAVFTGAVMWCFYLAVEPFVRRFWPTTLITWTRLLRGNLRDRQVGRDILVGLAAGVLCHAFAKLWFGILAWYGTEPRPSIGVAPHVLLGMRESFGGTIDCASFALTDSMFLLMFLFAIRWPMKTKGIATCLFVGFFTALFTLLSPEYALVHLVFWSVAAILLTRLGIVALIAFQFVRHVTESFPLPADMSQWYASFALVPFSIIIAFAICGYWLTQNPPRVARST